MTTPRPNSREADQNPTHSEFWRRCVAVSEVDALCAFPESRILVTCRLRRRAHVPKAFSTAFSNRGGAWPCRTISTRVRLSTTIRATGPILAVTLLCEHVASQELAPEVLALARASRLAGESVAALANCACLESVTRTRADKKGKVKRNEHDALQIEVSTIGDREWFSWPGRENAFVENPAALVGFGLMTSGQLTSILKTVFLDGYARRTFHGAGTFQSRPALQFDYSVSSVFTHFRLSSPRSGVTAGMQGTFWIDPETAELLALSSEATELPADFEIRSARTEVVYAPMYLGDRRVVLPQTANTVVEHSTGAASINQVEFSHCRPYSTTSSIRFGGDDAVEPAPAAAPIRHEEQPIPSGLSLRMRLGTPLTERSGIGERFTLIMEEDARDHGDTIIVKGAKVQARVRWIETTSCPARCFVVAIELLSVTTPDGTSHPVYASLRQVTPEPKVRLGIAKVTQTLTEPPFGMQRVETSALSIEIPQIPGVGSFFVLTPDLRTPPDLLMTWSTENPHP